MLGHHIDLSQMGLVLVEIEQGEAHRPIFFVRGDQQATVAAVRAELFHRMDGEIHGSRRPTGASRRAARRSMSCTVASSSSRPARME